MRFVDRHASDLEYQARVLRSARRTDLPLLDRCRFVAFFSTLSDEFFRVRVAGLAERHRQGLGGGSPTGHSAAQQLRHLNAHYRELAAEQHAIACDELLPALEEHDIRLVGHDQLDDDERAALAERFDAEIFPVLTPLAVGPANPFPFISDLSLSIGVVFDDREGPRFARVKVPRLMDRLQRVPGEGDRFVLLEEVIAAHLDRLFPGRAVRGWHTFRVTRDADYDVEDVDVDDLREAVASEIADRRFGRAVRLEVDDTVPADVVEMLSEEMDLDDDAIVRVPAPLDLAVLGDLADLDRPELRRERVHGVTPEPFRADDLFARLRDGDVLVQFPYDDFGSTTLRFVEDAADDPDVLAIKMTLYRTSGDSPIVRALVRAAEGGKQVAAVVELMARFDERANIDWAAELEDAGVHVVYGFVEMKTHTKTILVVRREADGTLRRYGHVGSGNFNPATARVYEDVGLFTADEAATADLGELFNMLTASRRTLSTDRLLVAPTGLRARLLELIAEEAHPDGRIVCKTNNLSHAEVVEALYAASRAGCEVDLVVRSVCTLVPGVPDQSDNIRVRSVVGSVLEHSRIYRFGHDPAPGRYLVGSADLMPRNLDNRVEAVVGVEHAEGRALLDDVLDKLLADEANAWQMHADGTWTRVAPADGREQDPPFDAQLALARARTPTDGGGG